MTSGAVRLRATVLASVLVASVLSVVAAAPVARALDPEPPVAGATVSVEPTRVLDTRTGNGAPAQPVAAGGSVTVRVTGRGAIPADGVASVSLTVTVTQPRGAGYLTVRPTGGGSTGTSNLNFVTGQTIANSATVALGGTGQITVDNASPGSSQIVVDVTGYTIAGTATVPGAVVAVRPARILDTRSAIGTGGSPVKPGASISIGTVGRGGLPLAGVGAVLLNVTATRTTGSGYLALGPADAVPGTVSNLNWSRTGQTVANQVQARVDADGRFVVVNRGGYPVDVVADVQGYVLAGRPATASTVATFAAQRAADTRRCCGGPVSGMTRLVDLSPVTALPPAASPDGRPVTAVVATVTVTNTTGAGYLTVWSGQGPKPLASSANWAGAGQTLASLVVVPVSDALHQQIGVAVTGGRADVVVDVSAYVLQDASAAPPAVDVAATGFQQNGAHDGHAAGSLPSSSMTQRWDVDFAVAGGYPEGSVVTVGHPVVTASGVYVAVHHQDPDDPDNPDDGIDGFDLFHVDTAGAVFGPVTIGTDLSAVDLVTVGDFLVTVDSAGRVAGTSLTGGAPWEQVLPYSQAQVGAAAYGGRVFVASQTDLWALDGTTGAIAWHVVLPAGAADPVVAADATGVYVSGSADATAVAYTTGGVVRWTGTPGVTDGSGTSTVHHNRLWVRGADADTGAVLDATTGSPLHTFAASTAIAFAQNLAMTTSAGVLTASAESDGTAVWDRGTGEIVGAPLTTDDSVFVGASDDTVRSYAVASGLPLWSAATPTTPSTSGGFDTGMAIGAGLLLVPNTSHLTAFG